MLKGILRQILMVAWLPILSSMAYAAPVSDIAAWAHQFQDAAGRSDFESMQRLVNGASDPRLKLDHVFEPIMKTHVNLRVVSVEQFNNKDLGSFFKRVNFAVLYDHAAYFYSVEFAKEVDGWQILGFGADGNVNKILSRQWPG